MIQRQRTIQSGIINVRTSTVLYCHFHPFFFPTPTLLIFAFSEQTKTNGFTPCSFWGDKHLPVKVGLTFTKSITRMVFIPPLTTKKSGDKDGVASLINPQVLASSPESRVLEDPIPWDALFGVFFGGSSTATNAQKLRSDVMLSDDHELAPSGRTLPNRYVAEKCFPESGHLKSHTLISSSSTRRSTPTKACKAELRCSGV